MDWSRKQALKTQLVESLQRIPPGSPQGVDLPGDDPLYAVAAQEILKDPRFRIIRGPKHLTLMWAEGVARGASSELREQLQRDGVIVGQGARLYHER